jgi:subtilisin family serine protease
MAAGIETAYKHGSHIINLSLGTPNMGKALLLREACANAVESGAVVLAAAHPKRERAYPADLPETVGVATHNECPLDKVYYYSPARFSRADWGNLSDKYLTHGYEWRDGRRGAFKGTGHATAYLSGRMACLREALIGEPATAVVDVMRELALTPVPELGYA